jgi:hypothetical protein
MFGRVLELSECNEAFLQPIGQFTPSYTDQKHAG